MVFDTTTQSPNVKMVLKCVVLATLAPTVHRKTILYREITVESGSFKLEMVYSHNMFILWYSGRQSVRDIENFNPQVNRGFSMFPRPMFKTPIKLVKKSQY